MREIVYSLNGEDWEDYDRIIEDAEELGFSNLSAISVKVGNTVRAEHSNFVDADRIIEEFQDRAYDEHGEGIEDYLEDVSKEKRLELESLIVNWLDENAKPPTFYSVTDIKDTVLSLENNT